VTKVLWVLAAFALAGCSVSSDGKGSPGHVTQYSYDPALCTTLLPDTGDTALYANLRVSKPIDSVYYAKRYNRAVLEGVLTASGEETQNFVAAMGIDLSKVSYVGERNTCLFQHSLPVVSDDLAEIWNETAGGDHGGGHLDGLFVAFSNGQSVREAIMVREDSSRWTLVHEMMHANFFRQRQADGVRSGSALRADVRRAYAALKNDYATYKASPSAALLTTLVSESDDLSKLLYQSLVSGSLEEIADESLLLQEWSDGRLKYVSPTSVKNAAWYIDYSRKLSLQDLNSFAAAVTTMRDQIGVEAVGRFEPTLDFIKSINTQTDALAEKARAIARPFESLGLVTGTAADRAHVEAMANTPALREFRAQTADFLNSL
jgi:hypothetical protein